MCRHLICFEMKGFTRKLPIDIMKPEEDGAHIKRGDHMPGEKEINISLFDQLTIIERIERELQRGGIEAVEKELEILKNEINRKLYQKPPLDGMNS